MENQRKFSDGAKIRDLRQRLAITQDKLALMSKVDRRTVQRAEQGTHLQMETLASLAAALSVPVSQIIAEPTVEIDTDELTAKSLVVLNRVVSGIMLLNLVRDSYDGKITCEADPTADNVTALTGIVGKLEELMPQPWVRHESRHTLSLSERLRLAVTIGEQLKELEGLGVAFYAGTYTARTQVPIQDHETGDMYVYPKTTPFELVTMCLVIVAPLSRGQRITAKADDVHVPAKAPSFEPAFEGPSPAAAMDDDIPF